jgi:hypothetical protein
MQVEPLAGFLRKVSAVTWIVVFRLDQSLSILNRAKLHEFDTHRKLEAHVQEKS